MDKMHRAQILINREQHKALAKIARKEGTSISEIVRQAVQDGLDARLAEVLKQKRLDDLARVQEHRQALLSRLGGQPLEVDIAKTLEKIREERQDELAANAFGRRG